MKETMRHIDKIIIKHTAESRAESSCSSDIDRQELINNYGNEKYLSKWSLVEGQDRNVTPDSTSKTADEKKSSELQPSDESQLPTGDDNESLVSYNSVCDGTHNTITSYLPYQIQQTEHNITLWQGYSGNIYFDPVKCRSVQINTSKPAKRKPKGKSTSTYRLTKSCSPSLEKHTLNDNPGIFRSASSFHSLGSLRLASREDSIKSSPRTHSQYGRLYKGFSDGKDSNLHRCHSTPESLVITGGQLNGSADPIDSVYTVNTKSRSRESQRIGCLSFPALDRECKWDRDVNHGDNSPDSTESSTGNRLPCVDQMSVGSRDTAEATPVFIIPFATLDDPVEPDLSSTKQERKNSNKNEKQTTKPKDYSRPPEKVIPKPKPVSVEKHDEKPQDSQVQPSGSQSVVTHVVNITGQAGSTRAAPRTTAEFEVRREISNSSLSNYLRAVPSQYSKTFPLQKQKKLVPKLSYTQRSKELRPVAFFLDGTDMYRGKTNGFSRTTALYGGYLPSTRPADAQTLQAEICSEASENDSMTSPREERRHVTHGHPIKSCIKKPVVHSSNKEQTDSEKCHLPVIGWHVS